MFVLCVKNYSMFQSPKENKKEYPDDNYNSDRTISSNCMHTYICSKTDFISDDKTSSHSSALCVDEKGPSRHPSFPNITSWTSLAQPSPALSTSFRAPGSQFTKTKLGHKSTKWAVLHSASSINQHQTCRTVRITNYWKNAFFPSWEKKKTVLTVFFLLFLFG